MRLKIDIKPKEATFQVMLDALALNTFYYAFSVTADVLAIYIEILHIYPKIPGQKFEDLPLEHDILSFIRDLRNTRDITYLTDVNIDYLHQPWRVVATVINKCLSGKEIDKIRLSRAQILWGDRVDTQSKAPDEQQQKTSGIDEGTGSLLGVPDVPIYASKNDKESWGDSDEEDDD
nr:hypothetical protein [Tanacetum cinerariifolium]